MPEEPTLRSRSKILLATGGALVTAAALLFGAILPAEYGVDPLGTGRLFGLLALGQVQPIAAEQGEYRVDRTELSLYPAEWVEYFYRLDEGSNMLYTWEASGPVSYNFHASPDGAPQVTLKALTRRRIRKVTGPIPPRSPVSTGGTGRTLAPRRSPSPSPPLDSIPRLKRDVLAPLATRI